MTSIKQKNKPWLSLGLGFAAELAGTLAYGKYRKDHQALIDQLTQNSQTAVY